MLRFLLFRFLPRRLLPILTILEVIWLVRRWQTRHDSPDSVARPSQSQIPAGYRASPGIDA